jgi:hypothetical protein
MGFLGLELQVVCINEKKTGKLININEGSPPQGLSDAWRGREGFKRVSYESAS